MFSLNNGFFRYRKIQSSILENDEYTFSDFWTEWGVIICVLVACSILTLILLYMYSREKNAAKAISIPGKTSKVVPSRIRKIVLYGQETVLVEKGDLFIATIPKKDGYSFGGWFYDSACTEPYKNKHITEDIVLYPKWTKES